GVTGAATTFTGTNTYSGWTYIFGAGTLNANSTGALSASADVYLAGGSTLNVNADSTINNIFDYGGPANTVNVNGTNALSVAGGTWGVNGGAITGTGTLIKYSTGTLTLTGPDTVTTAAFTINDGTVDDNAGAIGPGVAVQVNSTSTTTGVLDVNASDTIGSLSGTGANATVNLASGATLDTGGDNSDTTFEGMIAGAGSLTKSGTGTFTLTGANSYSGGTTINAGTLAGDTTSLQGAIVINSPG